MAKTQLTLGQLRLINDDRVTRVILQLHVGVKLRLSHETSVASNALIRLFVAGKFWKKLENSWDVFETTKITCEQSDEHFDCHDLQNLEDLNFKNIKKPLVFFIYI